MSAAVRSMPYLPDEVIFNILLKLPGKSLMRLKSVSNPWLTLLSSPHFIKSHLNHSLKNPKHILTAPESSTVLSINFETSLNKTLTLAPNLPQDRTFHVVGSCNGFLCLSDYRSFISLWNPSTQEYFTLPPDPKFGFPRSNVSIDIGFGYDAQIDEYKVVKFVHLHYQSWSRHKLKDCYALKELMVYTVGTNLWRSIVVPTKSWRNTVDRRPWAVDGMVVYLNCVMYWLNIRDKELNNDSGVGSFNVGTEELGEVFACPDARFYEKDVLILGVLRGNLSFTCQEESHIGRVGIWLRTGSSWIKCYTLNWKQHPDRPIEPVVLRKNRKLVLKGGWNNAILYDETTDGYKYCDIEAMDHWDKSFIYVESIISLAPLVDHIGGKRKKDLKQGSKTIKEYIDAFHVLYSGQSLYEIDQQKAARLMAGFRADLKASMNEDPTHFMMGVT